MSRYALHPEALADLDEIWDYIAERSVDAADRVIGDVFDTVETLASFPQIGHSRPDLTNQPLRFHVVRDLLIAYAPDEDPMWIVAVIHGRRHPRVMAAILRSREERT